MTLQSLKSKMFDFSIFIHNLDYVQYWDKTDVLQLVIIGLAFLYFAVRILWGI